MKRRSEFICRFASVLPKILYLVRSFCTSLSNIVKNQTIKSIIKRDRRSATIYTNLYRKFINANRFRIFSNKIEVKRTFFYIYRWPLSYRSDNNVCEKSFRNKISYGGIPNQYLWISEQRSTQRS